MKRQISSGHSACTPDRIEQRNPRPALAPIHDESIARRREQQMLVAHQCEIRFRGRLRATMSFARSISSAMAARARPAKDATAARARCPGRRPPRPSWRAVSAAHWHRTRTATTAHWCSRRGDSRRTAGTLSPPPSTPPISATRLAADARTAPSDDRTARATYTTASPAGRDNTLVISAKPFGMARTAAAIANTNARPPSGIQSM